MRARAQLQVAPELKSTEVDLQGSYPSSCISILFVLFSHVLHIELKFYRNKFEMSLF
jgi:hypothetical protein